MQTIKEPDDLFPIGHKYMSREHNPRECEVHDILRTYDNEGHLVALRYVVTRRLGSRLIMDRDVVHTSIKMAQSTREIFACEE